MKCNEMLIHVRQGLATQWKITINGFMDLFTALPDKKEKEF